MREILAATDGHILTDGEIYGAEIYLAEGVSAEKFYEITVEEYQAMLDSKKDLMEETVE